ncbi:MAG: response regulator [Bacteroidales bacterium]|nr:response regulator [Bacteroidales bacterium]
MIRRLLPLLLSLAALAASAQDIRLSNRFVIDVAVDGRDRIWVGTEDGLNCYDGISNRFFLKGAGGLPSSQINGVAADREEPLVWVALQKAGLACYDLRTERFTVYGAGETERDLPDDDISHVELDPDGAVWASTFARGLVRFERQSGTFTRFNAGTFEGMRDAPLHTFTFRGANQLVLGYWSAGLSIQSLTDHSRIDLRHDASDPRSLPSDEVRSLLVDSHGRIWAGTTAGLALYSEAGRQFTVFRHHEGDPQSLPEGAVFDLAEDARGRLLVATGAGTVAVLDISGEGPVPEDSPFGLLLPLAHPNQPGVRAVAADRFGNVWAGTYGAGLQFVPGREPGAGTRTFEPGDHDSRGVQALCVGNDGMLLAGSRTGQVAGLHGLANRILPGVAELTGPVLSLLQDPDGRWWIGTEENGLYVVERGRMRPVPLSGGPSDIRALLVDGGGLWAASSRGLYRVDRTTAREAGHWTRQEGHLPDDLVRALYLDGVGRLWLGFYGQGLAVYDAGMQLLARYDASSGLLSDTVNDLFGDSRGRVWAATTAGLVRFDAGPGGISAVLTAADGLPDENVRALEEDGAGRLWMSVNDGVVCLLDDTRTVLFDRRDGLPDGNYYSGVSARSRDGRIWFGTTDGMAWVAPEVLLSGQEIPPVDFLTTGPGLQTDYHNNYLHVRFRVPDHSYAQRVEYAYRMPQLDADWRPCGPELEFHQLPYGRHALQVRARLHSQDWGESFSETELEIRPPFWLTWWAKVLYILLILGAVAYAVLRQSRHMKQRNQTRLQQDRLLQERQAGEERMVFYTNVTHELRTPLTLILGPLEDLSEDSEIPSRARIRIGKVKQSAQQLLGLVNQLLEFRKTETQNRRLTVEFGDLSAFVESVGTQFRDLSIDKAVTLSLAIEPGIRLWYDAEALTIILNNLLSNSRKFTPSGQIVLSLQKEAGQAVLRVSDTGVGIAPDELAHIFDRYYRADGTGDAIGTGIGLALVKNLCDLHRIDLKVASEPGRGTEFRLALDAAEDYPEARRVGPVPEEALPADPSSEDAGGRFRILVVEDNDEIRDYIRESLAGDYKVLQAPDGRAGLKIAVREIPDVIVSDIMMPVMDGITFCKAIRQDVRTSHIPVILLTAKGSDESRVEGYDVGADSYLVKPFHKALLLSRIRNLMEGRRRMMREVSEPGRAETLSPVDNEFLEQYTRFVLDHIGDERIDIASLAGQFAMSQSTLYRKVKAVSGLSPNELIRNIRLDKAADLLKNPQLSVSEISWQVGFGSPVYFRTCFKERFGKTPSEYRLQ